MNILVHNFSCDNKLCIFTRISNQCNTVRQGFEQWIFLDKLIVLCAIDLSSSCSYCFHRSIGFYWLKIEVDSCPVL